MDDNNYPTISESAEQNGSMPQVDPSDFTETQHYKNIELSFIKIINFVKQNNSIEETIEKDVRKKIKGLDVPLKY